MTTETDLLRHPSPIARAAGDYVGQMDARPPTRRKHALILELFIDCLLADGEGNFLETDGGEILATHDWDDVEPPQFGSFVEFWLPRKWMGGDEVVQAAPGVLRKWLKWCVVNGQLREELAEQFREELPVGMRKEVKRLQNASDLLYRLHSPAPGAWMHNEPTPTPLRKRRRPDRIEEGYFVVDRVEGEFCMAHNYEGEDEVFRILVGTALGKALKSGDIFNAVIGRQGKTWIVLESGNVYGAGTF